MEVRVPEIGEVLVHRFRHRPREVHATVVRVSQNPLAVVVQVDGKEYQSLSAAASATSGSNQNGWVYWGLKKQQAMGRHRNRHGAEQT